MKNINYTLLYKYKIFKKKFFNTSLYNIMIGLISDYYIIKAIFFTMIYIIQYNINVNIDCL